MLNRTLIALALLLAAPVAHANGKPTERRLHLAGAEASSHLVNDWNRFQENYLPLYVGDDDPVTAWTDGVDGEGIGEWIRLRVTKMDGAGRVRLRIRNGYQKSKKLFAANARVKAATIVLLPSKHTTRVELRDQWDWQDLSVEQPPGPLEAVELKVESVYPGSKYDDVCLSDVQLHVTATTPENAAFEKQRFDKIRAWRTERAQAARLFKSAAARALPVGARYVRREEGDAPEETRCEETACFRKEVLARARTRARTDAHRKAVTLAETLLANGFRDLTAVQPVAQDRRGVPAVEGLCTTVLGACQEDPCYEALPLPMAGQLGFLDARQVSTLTVKDAPSFADVIARKPKVCGAKGTYSFGWVLRPPGADGQPGALAALLLAACGLVEGREGFYPAVQSQLLVFGTDGRLDLLLGQHDVVLYDWRPGERGPMLAGGTRIEAWSPVTSFTEAVDVAKR